MPPLDKETAQKLIKLRHGEWQENQRRWRFLQDSLEGGNRYRYANYVADPLADGPPTPWYLDSASFDPPTGQPRRVFYGVKAEVNLIPHLSETTPDGVELYAMRLERTPIPTFLSRAVRKHLSRIYGREVSRAGPDAVLAWWDDVDGAGATIDQFMRKRVAPLLLALGQLDLCFDRPAAPPGVDVASQADVRRYGLDGCVVGYILPENMPWWRLDARRRYAECLVYERTDLGPTWRHWTATESNAYAADGTPLPDRSRPHPFGRVPIVRVFDERKARCSNAGQSRYEAVAELQRERYNKDSEAILADIFACHPTLQGPEEFVTGGADGSRVPVGPGNVLPMKKDQGNNGNVTYESWSYVEAAMTGMDSLRHNAQTVSDEADREASLLKPAGQTGRSTTSQSGVSKQMDEREGNDYLGEISQTLADCEVKMAREALNVLSPGAAADAEITVVYPKQFDLATNDDLLNFLTGLQAIAAAGGELPTIEAEAVKRLVRVTFVGITDEQMRAFDAEIDARFDALAAARVQAQEAGAALAAMGTPFGPGNPPPQGEPPAPGVQAA